MRVLFDKLARNGPLCGKGGVKVGHAAEPPEPYEVGELTFAYAERRVSLAGSPVQQTDAEYRMLFELSVNAGRAPAHAELQQRVWDPARSGRTGAVCSAIKTCAASWTTTPTAPTTSSTSPASATAGEGRWDGRVRADVALPMGSRVRVCSSFRQGQRAGS